MTDYYKGIPPYESGSGGGGTGDVTGPSSSTDDAVAVWNGTGGDTLQDSNIAVNATRLLTQGGTQTGLVGTTGLAVGKEECGFAIRDEPGAGVPYTNLYSIVNGYKVMRWQTYDTNETLCTAYGDIRKDNAITANCGNSTTFWDHVYGRRYFAVHSNTHDTDEVLYAVGKNPALMHGFGGQASNAPDYMLMTSSGNGVGENDKTLYFRNEAGAYAVYAENNATADANKAIDLNFRGGRKTAGTGDGGDVNIDGGLSASGSKGSINLNSEVVVSSLGDLQLGGTSGITVNAVGITANFAPTGAGSNVAITAASTADGKPGDVIISTGHSAAGGATSYVYFKARNANTGTTQQVGAITAGSATGKWHVGTANSQGYFQAGGSNMEVGYNNTYGFRMFANRIYTELGLCSGTDGGVDFGTYDASTLRRFNNAYIKTKVNVGGTTTTDGLTINATNLLIADIPVVGAQQAHVANADGTLADINTRFNELLVKLEAHGLLASS